MGRKGLAGGEGLALRVKVGSYFLFCQLVVSGHSLLYSSGSPDQAPHILNIAHDRAYPRQWFNRETSGQVRAL